MPVFTNGYSLVRFGNNFEGEWDLRTYIVQSHCMCYTNSYYIQLDQTPPHSCGWGLGTRLIHTQSDWYGHSIILWFIFANACYKILASAKVRVHPWIKIARQDDFSWPEKSKAGSGTPITSLCLMTQVRGRGNLGLVDLGITKTFLLTLLTASLQIIVVQAHPHPPLWRHVRYKVSGFGVGCVRAVWADCHDKSAY